jgi:predicted GNAT superfamily acetyltransferase
MYLRNLTTLAEFKEVVALEKSVWGYDAGGDVVPVPVLAVTVKRGAILIGAFDDRERMVGFVYSIPAIRSGGLCHWSHMLGVIDEHRGSGLGRRLKLEQRLRALDLGLDLIEWTYDPLQALNACLNFCRLGVIVEEYEENIYGDSTSPLHRGTPTDRFVAEWWIRSPRVENRIAGANPGAAPDRRPSDAVSVTRTDTG